MSVQGLISFSLYGDNPLYTLGAIENARLAPEIYPGWTVRFYVHNSIHPTIKENLKRYGAEVVVIREKYRNEQELIAKCTFWRYYAMMDAKYTHFIFRDCDSRIGHKEAAAVAAWIASGKPFHMLYDHPQHVTAVLGGLWGARYDAVTNIKKCIVAFFRKNDADYCYNRSYDQVFLRLMIWPNYIKVQGYLAHAPIGKYVSLDTFLTTAGIQCEPFPPCPLEPFPRSGLNFPTYVGETVRTPYWTEKPPKHGCPQHTVAPRG